MAFTSSDMGLMTVGVGVVVFLLLWFLGKASLNPGTESILKLFAIFIGGGLVAYGAMAAYAARPTGVGPLPPGVRATFAQVAKDRGATMEAVSRAMRHRTTKTTERYYARIRADSAFAEIERAFEQPSIKAR